MKTILDNSVKLSFTIIEGVRPNFVGRESFVESISPDILALCETNLHETFWEVQLLF